MANIVAKPLNRLRKHSTSSSVKHQQLHARWGDVNISTPTEGSWAQHDNPRRRGYYGPGYVPDRPLRAPVLKYKSYIDGHDVDEEDDDDDDEEQTRPTEKKKDKRHSPPPLISTLDPRRLSMRLVGGGKPQPEQQRQRPRPQSRTDFAYKPIDRHDYYPTEVAEMTNANRVSRFRYIPASPQFFEELERLGAGSSLGSEGGRDSPSRGGGEFRYLECENRTRTAGGRQRFDDDDYYDGYGYRHVCEEQGGYRAVPGRRMDSLSTVPRWVMGSSTAAVAAAAGQRNGLDDEKRKRRSRRMTTVMVPDAEDIYG